MGVKENGHVLAIGTVAIDSTPIPQREQQHL